MQEQTQLLYEDYSRSRNSGLTYDEFCYILNLFPSLIICMCDGKLDQGEWEAVLQIADGLAEGFFDEGDKIRSKSDTAQLFRTEFRYLLENIPKWEKKFLNVLKNHIRFNQSSKEFVVECMYLLANSADGISAIEQQNIDSLSQRLGITN